MIATTNRHGQTKIKPLAIAAIAMVFHVKLKKFIKIDTFAKGADCVLPQGKEKKLFIIVINVIHNQVYVWNLALKTSIENYENFTFYVLFIYCFYNIQLFFCIHLN